ncbi:MAG: cell filamentation protein Fic [Verrucomicrobia bacterium]|nr:MAG: cell filamentation protein Fic [Verrucomicrobiota bacterium]
MKLNIESPVSFQGSLVPPNTKLIGWAAMVHALPIESPVRHPSCVSEKHIKRSNRKEGNWTVFDKRYGGEDDLENHLTFALRHETIDLLILKRAFEAVPQSLVENFVHTTPTGNLARRVWFLYEFLTKRTLDLPDATGNFAAVDLLPAKDYFTGKARLSKRHRVRNNLLGNTRFCPIIRRTKTLEDFVGLNLSDQAKEMVGKVGAHLTARAASFMLLADSRASFEIEGERPPRNRLERWGRAVAQAGRNPLSLEEIVRLHSILIEDRRFIEVGLRPDGIFLGERDAQNNPLPEFIGARHGDLDDLIKGMIAANDRMGSEALDPVLQAAAIAFGFVYIHPLQDGNGRLHRYLFHHVLAERKFTPPGMVFPVSSVIFDRIEDYKDTLQKHSGPLMEFIEWRGTASCNVEVLNGTSDLYRYFDCTDAAEFLYGCVQHTVEIDLPREIDYLKRNDEALRRIADLVEMPDRLTQNLVMFIRQNDGVLPKRRREKEFEALTDEETTALETIVREEFEGFDD